MLNLREWLKRNDSLDDYDNPDHDPDVLISKHKKAVEDARSAIRKQLEQQFKAALSEFYSQEF